MPAYLVVYGATPADRLAAYAYPDRKTAWSLRHRPDVSRRVADLLKRRVEADSRSFARRQKSKDNGMG